MLSFLRVNAVPVAALVLLAVLLVAQRSRVDAYEEITYISQDACRSACSEARRACKKLYDKDACDAEHKDACVNRCKQHTQNWRDRCRSTCDYTYDDDKKKAKKCRKRCADHWD